ncbi:interleukin 17 [Brachionus plicatilis]|uniref:Interleukin 17 n=1 Tax=Brachionus plicatilis TaxID=10195 RepID=A0A3M7PBX2_BRAPC|nr:interleukin 17 [Brachionus plicatilis]
MLVKLVLSLVMNSLVISCCFDPGEDYLHQKLNEFIEATLRYEQIELRYSQFKRSISNTISDSHIFENTQCDLINRTIDFQEQKAVCPRQYKIIHRTNKFPYYIKQTVCTCRACFVQPGSSLFEDMYQCLPIWTQKHVLVRDECQSDGFFYWKPDYELINTGCTCGTNLALISFRSTDYEF